MAHAAKLHLLASRLIRSIITSDSPTTPLDELRNSTAKRLRPTAHNRTNQFEIQATLSGLVEKFAVLNREDLSHALQSRLSELSSESEWTPEVLSFILLLSNRPVEKTRIEDVEALAGGINEATAPLTWDDIVADDPLCNDDGLWDDVERGYHSSGDDATVNDQEAESDVTISTQATSVVGDGMDALAGMHVTPLETDALNEVESFGRSVGDSGGRKEVSELTLIRETLLMLHGLPTSLYHLDDTTGRVSSKPDLRLVTIAGSTVNDALNHFANFGSSVNALRHWLRTKQEVAYVQSCQSSTRRLLHDFARQLSEIEQKHILTSQDIFVSIMNVGTELENACCPFVHLSTIVTSTQRKLSAPPFALLDALYTATCTAELSSNTTTSTTLLPIFLAGLRTYLRSISRWVNDGICDPNDPISLVAESQTNPDRAKFWQHRYRMRTHPDGQPHVPALLLPFARRIFSMGKSRAFLRSLTADGDSTADANVTSATLAVPDLTPFAITSGSLLPFPQLFEGLLTEWLRETTKDATPALRHALLGGHGVLTTMRELHQIFCSADGSAFQSFAEDVFWSIDHSPVPGAWKNEFILTELAQSALVGGGGAHADMALTVKFHDGDTSTQHQIDASSIRQLGALHLSTLLPWPVQNITHSPSPPTYSKIFTLLLQITCAKSLLRNQFFALRPAPSCPGVRALLRLRQRLTTALDVLHTHITATTSMHQSSLLTDLERAAGDMDAMVEIWARADRQLEQSLLLSAKLAPLMEAVVALLEICERFAGMWDTVVTSTLDEEGGDGKEEEERRQADPTHRKPSTSQADIGKLHDSAQQFLSFLSAGVRGISRAGGNTALETLAERLEWIVH